ncbi:MAG: glutaredoxin family protein [Pseudoclavibacter sp.]
MEEKSITLYTLPGCVQCKGAQRRLDKQHVRYEVKDAAEEDNLRHLKQDLGFQQAPVMEDEDGNAVSGFNPEFIDQHARDADYQAGQSAEQQEFQQALGKLAQGIGPAQVLDEAALQRQEQKEAMRQSVQQASSRPKVSM